jgi:hypothetical protein
MQVEIKKMRSLHEKACHDSPWRGYTRTCMNVVGRDGQTRLEARHSEVEFDFDP